MKWIGKHIKNDLIITILQVKCVTVLCRNTKKNKKNGKWIDEMIEQRSENMSSCVIWVHWSCHLKHSRMESNLSNDINPCPIIGNTFCCWYCCWLWVAIPTLLWLLLLLFMLFLSLFGIDTLLLFWLLFSLLKPIVFFVQLLTLYTTCTLIIQFLQKYSQFTKKKPTTKIN